MITETQFLITINIAYGIALIILLLFWGFIYLSRGEPPRIVKLTNILFCKWINFTDWFWYSIAKYLPKIFTGYPPKPTCPCRQCGKDFVKLIAVNTGDGWVFAWECENHCGDEEIVEGYFPFVFNWATSDDLEKYGIEVV